jgi:hypothetical protein
MKESEFLYKGHRNSYTELNEVYFWTITINKWQHLLKSDDNKMIVIRVCSTTQPPKISAKMATLQCSKALA